MQCRRLAPVFVFSVIVACGGGGGHQGNSQGSGPDTDDGPGGVSGGSGVPGCSGLASTCGPSGGESCCASATIPGGTFYRGYDGATYTDQSFPATLSGFRLDRFLATVGRMRSFVTAV